ncbi:hypothetical protein [Demetria terragena]|uniref:hypothetical protein n=1 Tax=Demetria terragena TaxID=63959 RepID=UPI000362329D|nr:hypothetical protein [Demetria terragena]
MSRWRALVRPLRGVLVTLVVGLLVVAGGWWFDARHRADAGRVTTTEKLVSEQRGSATFAVPHGSVTVDIEAGRTTGDDKVRAPRDGRLVQASWRALRAGPNVEVDTDRPVELRLRIDGERYELEDDVELQPVDQQEQPDLMALLAVPTLDRHVVVEVEFAGRTQSVDIATGEQRLGAFAPLYRSTFRLPVNLVPPPRQAESEERSDGLKLSPSWGASIRRDPYLEGRGWAKPGREWVTLSNSTLTARASWPTTADRYTDVAFAGPEQVSLTMVAEGKTVKVSELETEPRPIGAAVLRLPIEPNVLDVPLGSALSFRLAAKVIVQSQSDDTGATRTTSAVVVRTASTPAVVLPGAGR